MPAHADIPKLVERKPVRILVAEDSPVNLRLALAQLEKLGYAADSVTDGAGALAAVAKTAYDIILMDCQMPEVSGYEATWQIRDREKEQAKTSGSAPHVRIIAMTANTEADNRDKCFAAGMDDYINKPVDLPELEAALRRALSPAAAQAGEVIDPVIIAGLRQLQVPGKSNPLPELIDLFLQYAPGQLESIEKAIAKNDMWSMSLTISAATNLKGSAANLGARGLAAICEEIEESAKAGLLADARPALAKAGDELNRVRVALEKIKSEPVSQRSDFAADSRPT